MTLYFKSHCPAIGGKKSSQCSLFMRRQCTNVYGPLHNSINKHYSQGCVGSTLEILVVLLGGEKKAAVKQAMNVCPSYTSKLGRREKFVHREGKKLHFIRLRDCMTQIVNRLSKNEPVPSLCSLFFSAVGFVQGKLPVQKKAGQLAEQFRSQENVLGLQLQLTATTCAFLLCKALHTVFGKCTVECFFPDISPTTISMQCG